MNSRLALASSLLASLPVFAEQGTASLDLVSEGNFNKITLTFTPPVLPQGTGVTTLTGVVQVLLEIDPATDQASEMTITGGSVSGTALTISKSNLAGSYNLTSSTLGAALDTPSPPGLVDPATGDFDAAQHTFTVDSGTLGGNISIPLLGINEVISFDFNTTPVGGAGNGTGNVSLVETGSTPTSKTYTVTVLMPISVEEVFDVMGFTIPITAIGTAKMVGSTTIALPPQDPYLAWTEANSIPGALFDGDENADGVPNGLQWGLGLAAGEVPFPFLLQPVGDTGPTIDFTVTLPPGGSAADLSVLVSGDPENVSFTPLSTLAVSTGNPVPAGTSGTVTISLPNLGQGFVRLAVDAPAP